MKITVIGEFGTGKTAWLKRLFDDVFEKRYIPTLGVEKRPLGDHQIWDTAGQAKFGGNIREYCSNVDLFIIFVLEKRDLVLSYQTAKRYSPNAPYVVVWNQKPDMPEPPKWLPENTVVMNVKTGEGIWLPLESVLNQETQR